MKKKIPKLLKLPTNWPISTGVVEKMTKGSVIFRNCWNLLAPSSSAASYISVLMLPRYPVIISIRDGIAIHAFTNRPIPLAHHFADASLVRKKIASWPAEVSILLIGPDCENMNLKPSILMNPGMAYARMGNARQIFFPLTLGLFSSSARPRPPKKLISVVEIAHSTFHERILPKVPDSLSTFSSLLHASNDQSASFG